MFTMALRGAMYVGSVSTIHVELQIHEHRGSGGAPPVVWTSTLLEINNGKYVEIKVVWGRILISPVDESRNVNLSVLGCESKLQPTRGL